MPKKPKSAFSFYLKERLPSLKKEKPDALQYELFKFAAEEWQGGKEINKDEFIKNAEIDKKRFKRQFQEFKKKGYYSNNPNDIEDDVEEDKKKSSKKRSSSKSTKKSKKKNKSKSKEKSKSKSKSKSKKKTQKRGKSKSKKKEKNE